MRVVFLSKKPSNSSVVDAASGTLLFQITTPGFRKRRTTMYDQQGNAVGIYQHRFWKSDTVTFRGQSRRLSEWMPKKAWSSSRKLLAPDGRFYTWKKKLWRNSFELVDRHTKRVVATARRKRQGTSGFVSKRRMVIDLWPDVVHMVDAVVFSFAIWDRLRRRQESASAASVAAAA
ncbi:hypothetical protein K466DRAFT_590498 [Polyporus arcularius HHB13444]|uniref:DUF6593 domain-containing protein n=1 Tax=Polyporus arcularius HHB13444 TaxID=1314778 RepID=A0A5C3P0W1_9APHY|nr:hypothetical protein K466DRAFT_590498 [Polyporus arcularius HHB13444]